MPSASAATRPVRAPSAAHGSARLEAPPDDFEERACAVRTVPVLLHGAVLKHIEKFAALRIHLFRLLVEAEAVLDLVEDELVDRAAQVLVVAIALPPELILPFQQDVFERHPALAADLALLHQRSLHLV